MPRETELEVRADPFGRYGPVETVDAAFVEPSILLLITAAALDEHLGTDAEGEAGARVVVAIDENVVVKDGEVARRLERDSNEDVIGIVGNVDVLIVAGSGLIDAI